MTSPEVLIYGACLAGITGLIAQVVATPEFAFTALLLMSGAILVLGIGIDLAEQHGAQIRKWWRRM